MNEDRKIWFAVAVAFAMASGVTSAQNGRFVHIESDDILNQTGGTITPTWDADPEEEPADPDEPEVEEDPDTGDYKCASPSNSKSNKGLGNNCSWCVNGTGTSMVSCKCDGDNKNHNDCDVTIEAGSGEFEVWNDEHTELIIEVLKDNGIEPPEGFGEDDGDVDGDGDGDSSSGVSPNDVEISSGLGRRL